MKKKLFAGSALLVILIALLHVGSAVWSVFFVEYVEEEHASAKIEKESDLDGYKIAFITDTHSISEKKLKKIVERLNKENVDVLLLGGDYSSSEQEMGTELTLRILSTVKTKEGIYGVEGNHDRFEKAFAVMEEHGIIPLSNSGLRLKEGLFLAGVEDLWNRRPDAKEAMKEAQSDDFRLLICHNPDYTMSGECSEADLTFSGHTHGGQITFLGFFAPALSMRSSITDYGSRFKGGWCKGKDDIDVFVSNGTGSFVGVPRIFANPQVVLMTLRAK